MSTMPLPRSLTRLVPATVLLLALSFGLAGCFGQDGDPAGADSTATADADSSGSDQEEAPKKEKAIRVNVGQVRRGDLVLPVYADGEIRTPRAVTIKAKVGGQLTEVLVRDGDQVKPGQLLARIDPREYQIALEESRFRHLQALSQLAAEADTLQDNQQALTDFAAARKELQRMRNRGSLTQDEYQARLIQLEMDALEKGAFRESVLAQRTGLAEARMAEERARLNLEYSEIRAPFAGTVQGLAVVDGEIMGAGATVCSVYDNAHLEATVNVLEADLGNLTAGRPALLEIPATGQTLETVVDVISPSLDAATRTCEVILRFDNPDGRLRPGMFVRAQIAGWIHPDKLMAPKDALLIRDSRTLVFKRVDDRAKWLYVDVGLQNDDWVEITAVHSGGSLEPGDEVVVSDHLTLAHEAKIKVRKTIPPTDRWGFAAKDEAGSDDR